MSFGRGAPKVESGSASKPSGLCTGLARRWDCFGTVCCHGFGIGLGTDLGTDLGPFDLTLLARRRPWASTPHLALTYLRSSTAASAVVGSAAIPASNALILSVSKRLAPAAPVRNMVRRVLREAWRHQLWLEHSVPLAVMIRLRALPLAALPTALTASAVSTVSIQRPVPNVSAKPPKGRAVLRVRRTDRALKAMIRAEADSLLEGLGRSMNPAGLER